MENILGSDISVVSLLVFFIVGLLTKRFVPWWVYEEAIQKLKEYEDAAPELLEEMNKVLELVRDPKNVKNLSVVAPEVKKVEVIARAKRKRKVQPKISTQADLQRARQLLEKARKRVNSHE